MPPLQPIHFDLANVDINIEPPTNLPAVTNALVGNKAFSDDAFTDGAIPLGSIKASASKDFKLDKVSFAASGGAFAGVGIYRSTDKLFGDLKAEGLDEPMVTKLVFPDLDKSNLFAIRWGYNVAGSASGSVALGTGLGVTFGASATGESLYAVIRSQARTAKAVDALASTINSWKMPRQVTAASSLDPGTWLISEIDGELKLSLGVQYGYDYSWVRESLQIGGLSGDFGLKIEMGVKAAFGFNTSGRYALVLSREGAAEKLHLQVFKMRQQGWSFAADATISAQANQNVLPDNFEEFIKGVFNLHGLQVITDIESVLDSKDSLAAFFGAKFEDYALGFVEDLTGLTAEAAFNKGVGVLKDLITRWQDLPHEITSLLYGLIGQGVPLDDLKTFLTKVIDLTGDTEKLKDEILSHLTGPAFFETPIGKWLTVRADEGIMSLLANLDTEKAALNTLAQKSLALLDGSEVENTLKKLQAMIEDRLGLQRIFAIVNQADFDKMDKWLEKRLTDFLGSTVVFQDLEKLKVAINAMRDKGNEFYKKGLAALTEKYTAEFHFAFQKSTSKTALIDVTFDFDAATGNAVNAAAQLKKALGGDFGDILGSAIAGVDLQQGVLTHEIKRNTHLEVKLPYFSSVRDHITESLATGSADNVVDQSGDRLWLFNLTAQDTVSKKNSISKLSIAIDLTTTSGMNSGVRQFSKESFRYDYTMLIAKQDARREFLRDKLQLPANRYFSSEFQSIGRGNFDAYLTDLDKLTDQLGIGGTDKYGNVLAALNVGMPGAILSAWKNAPSDKKDPAYMEISLAVQRFLRSWIITSIFQDTDEYHQKNVAYPVLLYSSLPGINKVEMKSGSAVLTQKAVYDWDYLDDTQRNAVAGQFCGNGVRQRLIGIRTELIAANDDFFHEYGDDRVPNILGLQSGGDSKISKTNFVRLVQNENDIINGIVATGTQFRKFMDAKKLDEAIESLAKFGQKITDAFNENIGDPFGGDRLRPLGTLLLIEIAKAIDPQITKTITPSAMLDIYVLKAATPFDSAKFFGGTKPTQDEYAIHQPIVSIGDASI